jgi:2-ketoarginine methyltransferase
MRQGHSLNLLGLPAVLEDLCGFSTSMVLMCALQTGILDSLQTPLSLFDLSKVTGFDGDMLSALLKFLNHSGHIQLDDSNLYSLTSAGQSVLSVRGWIELIVGGYGPVLLNLETLMERRCDLGQRNMAMIAAGSANIAYFDSIPLTLDLIRRSCSRICKLVDLGCGNAKYLLTYVDSLPGIQVEGCEPSEEGFVLAIQQLRDAGREQAIKILRSSAQEYPLSYDVDIVVLAFVLHEICGSSGESAVVSFLQSIRDRSKNATLIIIEVDADLRDVHMRNPIGRGYYNAYHMLHPFTGQKLLTRKQWEGIFSSAGYDIVAEGTTTPEVDPSGLELGYALKPSIIDLRRNVVESTLL